MATPINDTEDDTDEDEDGKQPYDSVASRQPLEDVNPIGGEAAQDDDDSAPSAPADLPALSSSDQLAQIQKNLDAASAQPSQPSLSDAVKNAIAQRMAPQGTSSETLSQLANDPYMKQFNQDQAGVSDLLKAKLQSDSINNQGLALQQIAQGANTPTGNPQLAKNLADQSADILKAKQNEVDQRRKVVDAIQARNEKARETDQRSDDRQLQYATLAASKQIAGQDKKDQSADKNYTSLRKDLETFRGNQAAQQAATSVLSADKALAMVKNRDPNTLTTQDLSLLAEEMGKIASGGVPSEHGVQALLPNNLSTKVAEMQNFLSSKPTDANAAAYIQHNLQYLNEMKNVAQNSLDTYKLNILKGYKNRVKPDDYKEALSDIQKDAGNPPSTSQTLSSLANNPDLKGAQMDTVRVQAPDGSVRLIPSNKVSDAIAAGGTRLE